MRTFAAVIVWMACTGALARAEPVAHDATRVVMEVPDNWPATQLGDLIIVKTPKPEVSLTMVTVEPDALKDVVKDVKDRFGPKMDQFTVGEPRDVTLHGMHAVMIDAGGVITKTTKHVTMTMVFVDAPTADKKLLVAALGEDAAVAKYKRAIAGCYNSLRPKAAKK